MKRYEKRQKSELVCVPAVSCLKTKCVNMLIYEEEGKTVLQPLPSEQETTELQELFHNNTLEVWLSNGKSDVANYDVWILKYKAMPQKSAFTNTSNLGEMA